MTQLEQQVLDILQALDEADRQKVLAFASCLQTQPSPTQPDKAISALKAAGAWVGCVEAAPDLSTNPDYLEGFGQS